MNSDMLSSEDDKKKLANLSKKSWDEELQNQLVEELRKVPGGARPALILFVLQKIQAKKDGLNRPPQPPPPKDAPKAKDVSK